MAFEHYNLLPSGCNWFDRQDVIDSCGSLFPFIHTKTGAIKYAKSVKKKFPDVEFTLTKGDQWGNQELILEL